MYLIMYDPTGSRGLWHVHSGPHDEETVKKILPTIPEDRRPWVVAVPECKR